LFKAYYQLTKPGIIYGNIITAAAGFLLASKWHIHWTLLLATLVGTALVIASACVFNNYLDRGIDEKMQRTRHRALVTGTVPIRSAIIYASLLGAAGFAALIIDTNGLVVAIGALAFVDYVALYGLAKRRSKHGTLVGTIAGAAPLVAGYCAVTDRFNAGAVILFVIMACWQMSHFYAIAVYRLKDYKAAGLPVWPVEQGLASAKRQILGYTLAFLLANLALSLFGYAGYAYAIIMTLLSLWWLRLAWLGFQAADDKAWGRQLFLCSLVVIMGLSAMLAVGAILP